MVPVTRWRRRIVILIATICIGSGVTSFHMVSMQAIATAPCFRRRTALLMAKPPSSFDLGALEAFEKELDANTPPPPTIASQDNRENRSEFQESDSGRGGDSQSDVRTYVVPKELHLKRIDAAVSALEPELSRSHCGALVTDGMVSIVVENNKPMVMERKSHKVEAGTTLVIRHPPEERPTELVPQKLPLDILFEDEHMIVLNKAAGMVVHPAAGNWDGTVVNALAHYLMHESPFGRGEFIEEDGSVATSTANGIDVDGSDGEAVSFRPGIVHRLDKGTTGILVVAKTRQALSALSEAFASRTVKKTYVALTIGNPGKRVVIDKPIGRHPIHRQRMRVVPDPHKKDSSRMTPEDRRMLKSISAKSASQAGRRALSFVDTMAFDGKLSVVQVRIETGRTHQIRVHLQDRHTPIYGDEVYGLSDWNKQLKKSRGVERPLLHAHRLELVHPILTEQKMVFLAPMAKDMAETADTIWPQGREERPDLFYGHGKQQESNNPQQ